MSHIDIIICKDQINTLCQVHKCTPPVFSFFFHCRQRIPLVTIGRLTFVGQNRLVDDKTKEADLLRKVSTVLNDADFIAKQIEYLSASQFCLAPIADVENKPVCVVVSPDISSSFSP